MPLVFSAVVCTHDRSKMLRGCLESLCRQTLDKSRYEVIVVDNNSTDNTRLVVNEFIAAGNVRYVLETQLGLCSARNRGWKEARGDYVAYIDDDARASENWLEVADELVRSLQPDLDCLGGPYHPFYTSSKPAWFLDRYEIRDFGDVPGYLERGKYISGSNMIWSKKALDSINGFNENIGIVGNTLELGDETEAIDRLWQADQDVKLYASPALIVYHWVPGFKMKVSYRLKRKFVEGQFLGSQMRSVGFTGKLIFLGRSFYLFSRAGLRFLLKFNSHLHWQNWVVEDASRIAFYFGHSLGCLGIRPKMAR